MVVLGLSTFGENPAACLVIDGELKAFCQEERLARLKGMSGHFPTYAVNWSLDSCGLRLADVDRIAVGWDCTKYPWRMLRHLAGVKLRLHGGIKPDPSSLSRPGGYSSAFLYLLNHTPAVFEQKIRDHLRDAGHKGRIPQIVFVPHHEAHAYQAFHQSPFAEAGVLVVDGSGEEKTVSAFHFHPGGWRRCFDIEVPNRWAGFTELLPPISVSMRTATRESSWGSPPSDMNVARTIPGGNGSIRYCGLTGRVSNSIRHS